MGAPGKLSELRKQAPFPNDYLALSAFIRVQAIKALSQTERMVFGDRYKVPRFVVEQILREAEFQDRAAAAGASVGFTHAESARRAERGLRELATGHRLFHMQLFRGFAHWLYTRVYDPEIDVEQHQLEQLRKLGNQAALVFVPSHKSNFDHLTMYCLLFRSGFPPPHTAAGINMAFFPMNRILPRTGAYFIRRSFQDDPIYKECLRAFINYLVQQRFHQEFFIEGGRTRSGKLLPPRYGMLQYIVEGIRKADVHDVYFIPTAITYSQLFEVRDYVQEQLGGEKERESFWFLLRMIRGLRDRNLGQVHIRFAEPITLRGHVERSGDDRLVVEKLAFQIANQINAVTVLTEVSVMCGVLLQAGRRALTLPELESEIQRVLDYAKERGITLGRQLKGDARITVERGLEALKAAGLLEIYSEGIEPVYSVTEQGRHIASYYRNTIIHFFLVRAITYLARRAVNSQGDLQTWALRLRELLKFEFFFSERDAFREQVEREEASLLKEEQMGSSPMDVAGPRVLRDYLESYWVVVQTLQSLDRGQDPFKEALLLQRCHAIGRQLLRQDLVHAPELLSSVNFKNALKLAINLGAATQRPEGYLPGDSDALGALARDLEYLASLARR
jgi:glycerol-3-phosphate O-acyltransferase